MNVKALLIAIGIVLFAAAIALAATTGGATVSVGALAVAAVMSLIMAAPGDLPWIAIGAGAGLVALVAIQAAVGGGLTASTVAAADSLAALAGTIFGFGLTRNSVCTVPSNNE